MDDSQYPRKQKAWTVLFSVVVFLLVLLATISDLFMGNPEGFGHKQVGTLLFCSLIIVLFCWAEPKPVLPRLVRIVTAILWVIVGVLGFLFYPDQWSVAYLLLFAGIGSAMLLASRVPRNLQKRLLQSISSGFIYLKSIIGRIILIIDFRRWEWPGNRSWALFDPSYLWGDNRKPIVKLAVIPFLLFLLFFLILFLQFPLEGKMPGNTDSWFIIAFSKIYINKIEAFFTGVDIGRAMYPVDDILAYGERTPGGSLLFGLFSLFGLRDYIAFYGFISVLVTLNAFGAYLLATLFVRSIEAAVFAGFAFACTNLMFAHIDDTIWVFFFLLTLSSFLLIRSFQENRRSLLVFAAIVGGLQAYFSFYVYIFQTILVIIIYLFYLIHLPKYVIRKRFPKDLLLILLYVLIALPMIFLYLWSQTQLVYTPTWDYMYAASLLSIGPKDFTAVLPNNLFYEGNKIVEPLNPVYWAALRHRAFIGWLIPFLALMSLIRMRRNQVLFLIIGFVALILALGPGTLVPGTGIVATPLYPIYRLFPIVGFIRVPIRAYFIVVLMMALLAAVMLDRIINLSFFSNQRRAFLFFSAAVILHILENTPFPLGGFSAVKYEISREYVEFSEEMNGALFLDLPTRMSKEYHNWDDLIFDNPNEYIYQQPGLPELEVVYGSEDFWYSEYDLFEYNREIIYMIWQTEHKQNIVGGLNAYYPIPRLIFQRWIMDLPEKEAVDWLQEQGVDYLIFHKTLVLPGEEEQLLDLESSLWISKIFDGEDIAVFQLSVLSDGIQSNSPAGE